jgi:8-oxo-dGTP pyrophosphatase MutT (NUDIX family)
MNNRLLDVVDIATLVASIEGEVKESAGELLPVFSGEGKQLGVAPRLLCHRLGLLHKVVFCFLRDPDGRLLLQTRKNGRLDVAVGGHVSSEDISAEDAILREIREEIGLQLNRSQLVKITDYQRDSADRLSKAREINRELRELFLVDLSDGDCVALENKFGERRDKGTVISISWFSIEDVLSACDSDKAADGLSTSISHYLFWLQGKGKETIVKC